MLVLHLLRDLRVLLALRLRRVRVRSVAVGRVDVRRVRRVRLDHDGLLLRVEARREDDRRLELRVEFRDAEGRLLVVLEFFLSLLLVVEPCAGVVGLLDKGVEVLLLEPRPLVGPDLRRVLLGQREGLAELLDGLGPRGQLLGAPNHGRPQGLKGRALVVEGRRGLGVGLVEPVLELARRRRDLLALLLRRHGLDLLRAVVERVAHAVDGRLEVVLRALARAALLLGRGDRRQPVERVGDVGAPRGPLAQARRARRHRERALVRLLLEDLARRRARGVGVRRVRLGRGRPRRLGGFRRVGVGRVLGRRVVLGLGLGLGRRRVDFVLHHDGHLGLGERRDAGRVEREGELDLGPRQLARRVLLGHVGGERGDARDVVQGDRLRRAGRQLDESPEDWHKRATLFKAGARLGAKPRTIAFHHDADIVCELAYDDVDKLPPGTPKTVALYNISGIAAFAADMAKQNTTGQLPRPKVQLSFTLDASGIASLSKAEVSVVEEYEVDAPPPKAEPKAEDNATAENATETNATDAAEATEAAKDDDKPAEAAAEAPTEAAADAATGEAAPEANASDANATGAAPGKVLKKKTHKRTSTA